MIYKEADELLTGRCHERRKLCNNTWLERRHAGPVPGLNQDDIAVRLHNTDVLTFQPGKRGCVVYRSGGWQTYTTKDRMNSYGPPGVRVSSTRGVWNISIASRTAVDGVCWECPKWTGRGKTARFTAPLVVNEHGYSNRATCPYCGKLAYTSTTYDEHPFTDGMSVQPYARGGGWRLSPGSATGDSVASVRKLRKRVRAYARAFADAVYAGDIGQPGPGDCWMCGMQTSKGDTLGEATRDREHLLSHVDESYFVPSLLVRACSPVGAKQGHGEGQYPCGGVSQAAQHDLAVLVGGHEGRTWPGNVARAQIEGAIANYVQRGLGLAAAPTPYRRTG